MTWGMVAVAGASLVGGALSSNAAGDAASQQQAGTQAGIESQERMFERSLELQEPYREAGYGALEGLQYLSSPEGRASTLSDYYGSDEYRALEAQDTEQQLRNAAATGGVRGGVNQAGLSTIAPRLGGNYLTERYNQLTGLANLGTGAASQGAGQAMQLGGNISGLQQNAATAGAQNSLAQANIWGNTLGTLGGLASDYYNQPKGTV